MPDIADLLAAAARAPGTDVDVAAVARRGRLLRRRRQGGIAVAAAVVLAVPAGVLATGDGPGGEDRLVPVPAVTSTSPTPAPVPGRTDEPTGVAPSPDAGGPAAPGTALSAAASASASPATARTLDPTATPTFRVTTTPPPDPHTYPVRSSCTVSTTGLTPGQSQTCRFTAAAAGGWHTTYGAGVFAGDYVTDVEVVVRRARRTWTYDGDCGTDLIRKGDRVTITIHQYDNGYSDHQLTAGAGYSC